MGKRKLQIEQVEQRNENVLAEKAEITLVLTRQITKLEFLGIKQIIETTVNPEIK